MFNFEIIAPSGFKRMPWKNGLGETTELSCKTDVTTKQFLWRLSIASVTEDGDFSDFTGFQRTLMMISGNGLILSHREQADQTLKNQYDLCSFDGAWKTSAKLIDGTIKDFNVICDFEKIYTKVSLLGGAENTDIDSSANDVFVFAHKSNGILKNPSDTNEFKIPKGHLFHAFNNDTTQLAVSGEGLICVEIFSND